MDRFEKKRCIFSGPNSNVYEAIEYETEKTVALKVVDVDLSIRPHNIKREISILKSLNHLNVLPYFESFQTFDELVLVVPFYEFDLRGLLNEHSKVSTRFDLEYPLERHKIVKNQLSSEAARAIFTGLVNALDYLHNEKGIIHRDLKPGNVFFKRSSWNPVLGDFGIAYPTYSPPPDEPPASKYLDISTGIYKAPELCFGVQSYGFEVDVWSLAIILTVIYSNSTRSIINSEGNDLMLINSLFTNFGTPSLDPSHRLYWPEMENDNYQFKHFDFTMRSRKEIEILLPRCKDIKIMTLFQRMLVYERSERITSRQLKQELDA